MNNLKAVRTRDGVRTSKTFECPHFTVDELLPDRIKIEFPQVMEDGTHPLTVIYIPQDRDAVYQISPMTGDTMDSWKWNRGKENKKNG